MIDIKTIQSISAQKGVQEIVVEKDYILDWLLWGISQLEDVQNNWVFKGGTALHKMFFTDWRFSEDLDFTTIAFVDKEILNFIVPQLCEVINKNSGLQIKVKQLEPAGKENEEWSYEIKLEYIGPRRQKPPDLPTVKLHITNDEPLLEKPQPKTVIQPYAGLMNDFVILTYSLEETLAEKLRTIIHQRCYPKDVYDTWRLLKECKTFLDIPETVVLYNRKCFHRQKNPDIPNNFDERLIRLKNQWKEGLKRQLANVPDFDLVYKELKELVEDFFSAKYQIKGGVEMLESNYSIKYRKGELEIEVHGDKSFVESKFKELFEAKLEAVSKKAEVKVETIPEGKKEMSLAEFLNSKQPKAHGDKILVFGYYLEKQKGYGSFNRDDIEKCYIDSKTPKTTNIGVYISQLISGGYIMPVEKKDNKKAWQLTTSGETYVEELPSQ